MKTFTSLTNTATNLANNTSPANTALLGQLINDQHRYLIQKYFDNERSFQTTTVGAMNLTLTTTLSIGATSATLTAVWVYPTCTQLVNFSGGQQETVTFTFNSANITWPTALNQTATTAISTVGVQDYSIPANVSKLTNDTISIGQLKYQPVPIMTRQEWDLVNFLPYTSDIPNYYFIYNGKLSIFPIPSTTGNTIQFNYKTRVADMTFTDYSTGNIASGGAVVGSVTITGLLTSWGTTGKYPLNVDISSYNLYLFINPPFGDGYPYPILRFNSDTSLTLALPIVNAPNITALTTYTIGQLPLLSEDFQDMLYQGALKVYFSSIVQDSNKFKEFETLYAERLVMLEDYAGTKSINVDLGDSPQQVNPNLFLYAN